MVGGQGVTPDPAKITTVQEWKVATSVRQVCSFLGFVRYYGPFIKDLSKVAKPLNELLRGTERKPGSSTPINWTDECNKPPINSNKSSIGPLCPLPFIQMLGLASLSLTLHSDNIVAR